MVGLGYIGLPTAALIAGNGIPVTGVDVNQATVDTINQGKIHIVEPDLDGLVYKVVEEKLLTASTKTVAADVFLIAVPTPFKEDHQPDLKYVSSAINNIIPVLQEGNLVIIESTSPVGTTEQMLEEILNARPELDGKIHMAYCPERVLPGNILHELKVNDRAIGGINEASTDAAVSFYKHFVTGELHRTNSRTAEMCKLTENASRDSQIAFANELSMICDEAGINVWELIRLANKHPRVNILQPGTGVGGHCIAVDPWFVISQFPEQAKMMRASRDINNYKTEWAIEKTRAAALRWELDHGKKPTIAAMGLAFKPNIDDLRESPARYVADTLIQDGHKVLAVEPNLEQHDSYQLNDHKSAMQDADIIVYLVAHSEFKSNKASDDKVILDFCNVMEA